MKLEIDSDGYPTEKTLRAVRNYHGPLLDFFRAIKDVWYHGPMGVTETVGKNICGHRVVRFRVHTWGWSGNESMVEAMEKNWLLWTFSWVESRIGGHYIFEFKRDMAIPESSRKGKRKCQSM